MSFEIKTGDIFSMLDKYPNVVAFVHGCNCFNTMRSGIAAEVVARWPEAEQIDLDSPLRPEQRLGNFTVVNIPRRGSGPFQHQHIDVYNAYTQFRYGRERGAVYVNYEAVNRVMNKIRDRYLNQTSKIVLFPFIGAGLAQGNPKRLTDIYEDIFNHPASPRAIMAVL